MKHILTAFVAGVALMACSPSSDPASETPTATEENVAPEPNPAPEPPVAGMDPAVQDACNMGQYTSLIGQPITTAGVPPEGPDVRYIRPGTQVTMDFRADRLNIDIDENEVITGFRCT